MENKDQCEDSYLCREKALQLSSEIKRFANNTKTLFEKTDALAKKAESLSQNVCLEVTDSLKVKQRTVENHSETSDKNDSVHNEPDNEGVRSKKEVALADNVDSDTTAIVGTVVSAAVAQDKCRSVECQSMANSLVKLLKIGKTNTYNNVDSSKKLGASAEDFVKSLDHVAENHRKEQSMFNQAIRLAEKISKGECAEDDLKEIELNSENGALSRIMTKSRGYMVTAKTNARHSVEALNNKMHDLASDVQIQNASAVFLGVTIGIASGYIVGYICKKRKCVKSAHSNVAAGPAVKQSK